MIENYEYISFDLYDTLVYRTVNHPQDIFRIVPIIYNEKTEENKINEKKYFTNRVYAEYIARKNCIKEDVTLDDIYNYLDYSSIVREKIKEIEIEVEIKNCVINEGIIPIIQECIKLNKKVIITTDMYLPRFCIKKILEKIEVPYNKLYISSEIGLTKFSGNLYKYILKDLNIDDTNIIHFGDNQISDIENAKLQGIKGQVRPCYNPNKHYLSNRSAVNPGLNHLNCLAKYYSKNTVESRVGTFVIAPVLVEFCHWIHKKKKELNIDKLYFIAREGYLIKIIYDKLFSEDSGNSYYLRLNKNIIRLPDLYFNSSIESFVSGLPNKSGYTWEQIIHILLLDSDINKIKEELTQQGIKVSMTENVQRIDLLHHKYDNIINILLKFAARKCGEQKELLIKYLKENGLFDGRIGLVNNSINGNAQIKVEEICLKSNYNIDMFGLQFVKSKSCSKKLEKKVASWLDSDNLPYSLVEEFKLECILFEHLLFENVGTANSLSKFGEKIKVNLDNLGAEFKNEHVVSKIQEGSLELLNLYINNGYVPIGRDVIDLYLQFKINPYSDDLKEISLLIDKDFDGEKLLVEEIKYESKFLLGGRFIPKNILWIHGYFNKLGIKNRFIFDFINQLRFNRFSIQRWASLIQYRVFDKYLFRFFEKTSLRKKFKERL